MIFITAIGSLITTLLNSLFIIFALTISLAYILLALLSKHEMKKYLNKNSFVDYNRILSSPLVPGIALIAPAYNESLTIIDNVKSLLSIMYNNLEIIIVNDGSKDNTMEKMISAFDLVKVDFDFRQTIQTRKVRGIYKSRNRAFQKLMVVDKENGGKADALNVGLNCTQKELVACVDVDCIIQPDALLRMVKPFMEESTPVIASGGVVRIANSCVIEEGRLIKVNLPENIIARCQVLEYIRAFLLGRMAWSRLNGLLLISGAFGLFRRDVAILAGGYSTDTVGEDMELIVRMRTYMHEHNYPYKVVYIPDPLCWTEAPSTYSVLGRQRNRWARGTFETLKTHKRIFLNPRYGLMGMLSYPFWLFFEWLTPFVEVIGILFFIVMAISGLVDWSFFFALLATVYSFAFFLSMYALLAEEYSFHRYTRKKDISKMIFIALLEPLFFHPRVVYWSMKGNLDLLKGKKTWGEMTRSGFRQAAISKA